MSGETLFICIPVNDVINDAEDIPSIDGRRITMLDVFTVIESDTAEENFDYWGLDDEKRVAVIEYYEKNTQELEELMEKKTP